MERLAAGAAGLALTQEPAGARGEAPDAPLTLPRATTAEPYPITPPRVYKGQNLEAIGMPLGGIGSGSIWLDGQGRLAVWQIFNNLSEPRVPDSFFAVRDSGRRRRGRDAGSADRGRTFAHSDLGAGVRGRLSDCPTHVSRSGDSRRAAVGGIQSADPLGRGQLVDSLWDLPFDGAEPRGRTGGSGVLRGVAERGGVRRGPRHRRRAARRLRKQPQSHRPRGLVRDRGDGQVAQPGAYGAAEGAGGRQARSARSGTPLAGGRWRSHGRGGGADRTDRRDGWCSAGRRCVASVLPRDRCSARPTARLGRRRRGL